MSSLVMPIVAVPGGIAPEQMAEAPGSPAFPVLRRFKGNLN
jgi:hypothetical protein